MKKPAIHLDCRFFHCGIMHSVFQKCKSNAEGRILRRRSEKTGGWRYFIKRTPKQRFLYSGVAGVEGIEPSAYGFGDRRSTS